MMVDGSGSEAIFKIGGTENEKNTLLWDLSTGDRSEISSLSCCHSRSSISFSPDGKYFAFGWEDTIRIYDFSTREIVYNYQHWVPQPHVSWSPNGNFIVSGTDDGSIILWDTDAITAPKGAITSASISSKRTPIPNESITVVINVDMSGGNSPNDLLGSLTASFEWDPNVLNYVGDSGLLQGFTGLVNKDSAANGKLNFNGANASGVGDDFNVLEITFEVVGSAGDSTTLNLEYSAMAAANTFNNLLPILTVNDGNVIVNEPTEVKDLNTGLIPENYALFQNHPNPFNPETKIQYDLPKNSHVKLEIFNMLGQKIRTLINEQKPSGFFSVTWDGKDNQGREVSSGVYLYRIQAGSFVESKKMLLLR